MNVEDPQYIENALPFVAQQKPASALDRLGRKSSTLTRRDVVTRGNPEPSRPNTFEDFLP
jgi:hypothetical protein